MNNKLGWIWKEAFLQYYPGIRLKGLRKTTNTCHDDQSPGRDLKPVPPKYEVGVLTTRPRRSVLITRSSVSLEADSHLLVKKFPPLM